MRVRNITGIEELPKHDSASWPKKKTHSIPEDFEVCSKEGGVSARSLLDLSRVSPPRPFRSASFGVASARTQRKQTATSCCRIINCMNNGCNAGM